MPSECELPARCQDCAKSSGVIIHRECNICQEMEFNEGILCDLNRVVQDQSNFTCHAFRPILTLAGTSVSSVSNVSAAPKGRAQRQSDLQLFCSDKMKYRLALALQKLDRDPNGVFMEFKYHFVWNVIHRKPVFRGNSKYFGFVQDTFLKCGELVGGFTGLLWLAPDHVHIYVESDGEKSVETIIHKIKEFSENAIVERFPDVRERVATGIEIWDEAYFAETVG